MTRLLLVSSLAAIAAFGQGLTTRQPIISAKSGVIQYLEGDVFLNDRLLETKIGKFEEMKDGQILRTTEGRAEVLLTPGTFLYVGESSSVKMHDARLSSTRMEVLSGSVIVQVSEIEKEKDHNLTFLSKDAVVELRKGGIYRIDAGGKSALRVYKGEAQVEMAGAAKVLGTAKSATLAGNLEIARFDNTTGDELYRWAKSRAGYLAVANVGAANTLLGSGYGYGGSMLGGSNCFGGSSGFDGFNGRWRFNPNFGMFTYVPCNGMYRDPYGYRYYSPYTVQQVYYSYTPPASIGGASTINNPRPASSTYSGPRYDSNAGYNTYSSRGDMSSYSGSSSGYSGSSSPGVSGSVSSGGGRSDGGGGSTGGGGGHSGGGHGGR
jgi:FecR protein